MVARICLTLGVTVEGIFRLAGSTLSIQKIRRMYESGERVDLKEVCDSPHSAASLLKQYLRELPEPLVPFESFTEIKKLIRNLNILI